MFPVVLQRLALGATIKRVKHVGPVVFDSGRYYRQFVLGVLFFLGSSSMASVFARSETCKQRDIIVGNNKPRP